MSALAHSPIPEPLLTTDQIAKQLGVSTSTIRRLTAQGMPSRVLLSRTRRFYASECVAWVDANCRGGNVVELRGKRRDRHA